MWQDSVTELIRWRRDNVACKKTIHNNKDVLDELTTDLEKVEKSIRIVKQNQSQCIKHDEFEERLKIVEAKLKKQEHNDRTLDSSNNDTVLYVRNLPYGMKVDDGLRLNSEIRWSSIDQSWRCRLAHQFSLSS